MESLEEAMDKAATHHIKDQGDLEKLIKELEEIRKRLGGDDK
jgi:hypothetical protein